MNDASETCAESVTTLDGLAVVKLALHVEPRRSCRQTQSKHKQKRPSRSCFVSEACSQVPVLRPSHRITLAQELLQLVPSPDPHPASQHLRPTPHLEGGRSSTNLALSQWACG